MKTWRAKLAASPSTNSRTVTRPARRDAHPRQPTARLARLRWDAKLSGRTLNEVDKCNERK